ncbi:MAG: endo-polygalacturonase, partial [Alistipes sp.]|nr:endo-polygalacturonase [Alistipes sp.]
VRLSPALQLVGTRPIIQPTPNDRTSGPGRRGPGSRGYGEFVVVPSYGPYIHNVTFRNICTSECWTDFGGERGNVVLTGIDAQHDVANITFDRVSYYGVPVNESFPNLQMNDWVSNVRFLK